MRSESMAYPNISPYNDHEVLVPINIQTIQRENDTIYIYDSYIVPSSGINFTFEYIKLYLKAAIRMHHDMLISCGCPTSFGFRVDCEARNVTDWSAALQLLQLSGAAEITICDYDNITHTLTTQQFTQLCGEIGSYLAALRSEKWRIRDAIDAAQTPDEAYAAASWS